MSIVTKTGDDGYSMLSGGERVPKHHPRLEAYGSIDEVQCAIGMVRAACDDTVPDEIDTLLSRLQKELFIAGADLATPNVEKKVPRITSDMVRGLETECKKIEAVVPAQKSFIIPNGTCAATIAFWARAVVRQTERRVAVLLEAGQRVATVLVYLNRLGDLLFLVARKLNLDAGIEEEKWNWKND